MTGSSDEAMDRPPAGLRTSESDERRRQKQIQNEAQKRYRCAAHEMSRGYADHWSRLVTRSDNGGLAAAKQPQIVMTTLLEPLHRRPSRTPRRLMLRSNRRRERQKLQFQVLQQQVAQMAQQERGTRLETAALAQVNSELQARIKRCAGGYDSAA